MLAAHQTAWRADPTLDRLLGLVDVATAFGELDDVLATEANRTDGEPIAQRPGLAATPLRLSCPACRSAPATPATTRAGATRSCSSCSTEPTTPAGATTGGGPTTASTPSTRRSPTRSRGPSAVTAPSQTTTWLLSTLLTDNLERHPPSAPERQRWLSTGRRLVDARIDEVVGGQHRAAYARGAHLAAACAEAIRLTTGPHAAGCYLDDLHTRYPRHSLVRREVRTIAAQSPLLG